MEKVRCCPDVASLESSQVEYIIGKAVRAGVIRLPEGDSWRDLVGDVFHMLYDSEPQVVEKPPEERIVNHAVMRLLLPEAENTRVSTAGSLLGALAATTTVYEVARSDDTIREAMRQQEEQNKEREEKRKQQQEQQAGGSQQKKQPGPGGDEQGDSGSDGDGDDGSDGDGDQQGDSDGDGEGEGEGQPEPNPLQEAIDKLADNRMKRAGFRAAMAKAGEKAQDAKEIAATFGQGCGTGSGPSETNTAEEIADLVNEVDKMTKDIADLVGRYRDMAVVSLQKVRNAYVGQTTVVGTTRDILHMFPTDRMYLMHDGMPALIRAQKIGRFVQSGLLGWTPITEGKGAGSTVIAVDTSGSMYWGHMRGQTMAMHAKCMALGIALAMRADKESLRDYRIYSFAHGEDSIKDLSSKQGWLEHIKWAMESISGGTDFEMAIRHGMIKLMEMEQGGVVGGDLTFITDGAGYIGGEVKKLWKEYCAKTGTRLIVIDVSNGSEAKYYPDITLLADKYVLVDCTAERGDPSSKSDSIVGTIVSEMELGRIQRSLAKEQ